MYVSWVNSFWLTCRVATFGCHGGSFILARTPDRACRGAPGRRVGRAPAGVCALAYTPRMVKDTAGMSAARAAPGGPGAGRAGDPMANDRQLDGLTVAILVSDLFEQVELTEPRRALLDAGAKAL